MASRRTRKGFSLIEILLVLLAIDIIASIAVAVLIGSRARARLVGARTSARLLMMALDHTKADLGRYPDGGTYTWSLIPGNVQFPGPNPVPSYTPETPQGYALELKLTIPTGSSAFFIQVRDPVQGNHFFQIDQNGVETTF